MSYSTSASDSQGDFYVIRPDNIVECKLKTNFPEKFPRFTDFLWEKMKYHENKDALICTTTGKKYTHKELKAEALKFGSRLSEMDILKKKGDTLAIVCPNNLEFVVAYLGVIGVGGVASPNNPIYVAEELAHNFHLGEPKAVLTTSKQLDAVLEALHLLGSNNTVTNIIVAGEEPINPTHRVPVECTLIDWSEVMDTPAKTQGKLLEGAEDFSEWDLTVLPFSSGTTGLAKGVHLCHRGLAVNLLQMAAPEMTRIRNDDIMVGLLPFFHIYGMNCILDFGVRMGLTTLVMEKFDPNDLLDVLLKYKPTVFHLVPPILNYLAKSATVKREHLESLKLITCGAAPASPTLIKELVEKFNLTADFQEGYGMTELSPVSHWLPYTSTKKFGSCGGPLPGTLSAVSDLTTGKFLGPDENGEILVKGPQVMVKYHKNPKATKETITDDGWLKTGDIGFYDKEGYFNIVDRVKELIKVKGLQVAPAELEDIIHRHPKVADVAVIGIPNEKLGEAPRAFVIPKAGQTVDPHDVADMVKTHVSEHKYLAGGVEIVAELPKSQTGKILRRKLKEEYLKRMPVDGTGESKN